MLPSPQWIVLPKEMDPKHIFFFPYFGYLFTAATKVMIIFSFLGQDGEKLILAGRLWLNDFP